MTHNDLFAISDIVEAMRKNSDAWHAATPEKRAELEAENRSMAQRLSSRFSIPVSYDDVTGVWYVGRAKLYDLY